MKEKKREISLYSFYDFAGIAHHLENRAQAGWQLEKIGSLFWHYRRCAPAALRYAVVYFAKASDLDAAPSQEQQDFWAMCQSTGWQLVANRGQMQVFCNPDPDALPIETDPVVQVENIRTSMKKGLILPYLVLVVCSLLEVALQFRSIDTVRDLLSNAFIPANLLLWGTLGLHCAVELLLYLRWLRLAGAAAREEGSLRPTKSHRWRQIVLLAACAAYVLLLCFSVLGLGMRHFPFFALLFGAVYALGLGCTIRGSQYLMKKKQVSPLVNRTVSAVLGAVVGIALMAGMVKLSIGSRFSFSMQGHTDAEVVTYTSTDGSRTYTYDFYRDDLPLTAEALLGMETDPDYSRRLNVDGTPFLTAYTASQRIPYFVDSDKPNLSYTVWDVGAACFYQPVKESFFRELQQENNQSFPLLSLTLVPVDAAPWGTLDAYRYHQDGMPGSTYLLCYESRFVEIHFDGWDGAAPTEAQMALVGQCLGSGKLA